MHQNGPIGNILDSSTGTFANFAGSGGSPWWVIFDIPYPTPLPLMELHMKNLNVADAPKNLSVEVSSEDGGPWSLIGDLSIPIPWDNLHKFDLSPQYQGRYVRLSITATHSNAAPSIQYVEFYTGVYGEWGTLVCGVSVIGGWLIVDTSRRQYLLVGWR